MDHVILTRFNLPSIGREGAIRASEGWLESRVDMFDRYCLPSVLAQSARAFQWLIYFDPLSPGWLIEKVAADEAAGHYAASFRAQPTRPELLADVGALFPQRGDEILTTSLDNDDALARDFVERLQGQPVPTLPVAYFFTHGLVKTATSVYRRTDRRNAFPSLRERWSAPTTVWVDWHNRLHRHAGVTEVAGAPAWLQVVHGRNVSNRTRGRLEDPRPYGDLFGSLLDDIAPPGLTDVVRDRALERPLRVARDGVIALGKVTAAKVPGAAVLIEAARVRAERRRSPDAGR